MRGEKQVSRKAKFIKNVRVNHDLGWKRPDVSQTDKDRPNQNQKRYAFNRKGNLLEV